MKAFAQTVAVEDPDVLIIESTVSDRCTKHPKYFSCECACDESNSAIRNFIVASHFERGLKS